MGHYQEERLAIEGAFKTVWAGESTILKFENEKTATTAGASYVTLTILTGEGEFVSVGSLPRRRYQGLIIIRVYTPEGRGNYESTRLLELAETAFLNESGQGRQLECGASGRITFRLPSREVAGIAGGYYTTILRVPFYRDQQGQ